MKIAIIADIHGNAPALEAVLADLAGERYDRLIDLGDAFNGPIDPAGVMAQLRPLEMVHIRGNGERMVLAEDPADRSGSATFTRERLDSAELEWISTWPGTWTEGDVFACHGTPASDEAYLLEDPLGQRVGLRDRGAIASDLAGIGAGLILCGHSHLPQLVQMAEGVTILNPGSVGLPAYSLSAPVAHSMETGSPHARYAIAQRGRHGWRVAFHAVPYDVARAARLAEEAGYPGWAEILRTGYAK